MLMILMFLINANAAEFKLNYNFKDVVLTTAVDSKDFNRAIELGADKCFEFYSNMFKIRYLTEDDKIGLANVCTNPR